MQERRRGRETPPLGNAFKNRSDKSNGDLSPVREPNSQEMRSGGGGTGETRGGVVQKHALLTLHDPWLGILFE